MQKRKTNKNRKRTEWYQSKLADAITAVQGLSKLRLSDLDARKLRLSFLDFRPPEWKFLVDAQSKIRARIEATDWRRAKGELLTLLAVGRFEVTRASDNFWPSSINMSDEDKRSLFSFFLVQIGIAHGDPYALAMPCAYFYQGGYRAVQEINRRWPQHGKQSGHFGLWASAMLYSQRSSDLTQGDAERLAKGSAKIISFAVRRKLPRSVWQKLDLLPETQTEDTIIKEWGNLNLYTAIAQGLDGGLNVVTTAAKCDTIDEIRKSTSNQARFEAQIFNSAGEDDLEQCVDEFENYTSDQNPETQFAGWQLLSDFAKKFPQEAALLYKRFVQDRTAAEIAGATGQYASAIEAAVRSAKDDFRRWYDHQK